MENESRTVYSDKQLNIEAYHFHGIMQKFPNHFHEHYVIGFVESGRRFLTCKNREYTIDAGDLLLFNPFDTHTCEQIDGKTLDWRCLNVEEDVMIKLAEEITGNAEPPVFTSTVAPHSKAVPVLRDLHNSIIKGYADFGREDKFYFLIEQLIKDYTHPALKTNLPIGSDIKAACDYMENNYYENISLTNLSRISGLKKYTLLRNFTAQKGITPYQYLSTIRINNAKKLLESGISPLEASAESGFADQSHFTRFFKTFIGLTPKQYQNTFHDNLNQTKSEDKQ